MSKFKVINRFAEKTHGGHVYEVGDVYPAEGKKLVANRAEFLTKRHAEYGVAFLEKVEEKSDEKDAPKKAPAKKVADKPAAVTNESEKSDA